MGTLRGLTLTSSTYWKEVASTTVLPDTGSSIRAYSPLGMIQVRATAMAMMTNRITKVWGMVKPFFFAEIAFSGIVFLSSFLTWKTSWGVDLFLLYLV